VPLSLFGCELWSGGPPKHGTPPGVTCTSRGLEIPCGGIEPGLACSDGFGSGAAAVPFEASDFSSAARCCSMATIGGDGKDWTEDEDNRRKDAE